MDLLTQIEQLQANMSPFKPLLSNVDLSTWAASDFDEARHTIVLSLCHYRANTLINAPLLLSVLGRVSISNTCNGSKMHMDVAISMLKTYLQTIHDFHTLLCSILARQPSFLRCNAVWWLCNYMSEFFSPPPPPFFSSSWRRRYRKGAAATCSYEYSGFSQPSSVRSLAHIDPYP